MRTIAARYFAPFVVCLSFAAHPAAQAPTVKITVPKANVRSEPSEKAPILQQVTPLDQIDYRATEGDWFKVLLPPNASLGGARVEAYISKKVSKLVAAPSAVGSPSAAPSAPLASAPPALAPPAPPSDTHGVTVFFGTGAAGTLLTRTDIQRQPDGDRQSWTVPATADWPVFTDRKPMLTLSAGDASGIDPSSVKPVIVRVASGASGPMIVGSMKGDRDWKADEVGSDVTSTLPGVWSVAVSRNLKPGAYAVMLRGKNVTPPFAWVFVIR